MKFIGKSSLKSQVVFHRLVLLDITGLGGTKLVGTGNSIDMNCLSCKYPMAQSSSVSSFLLSLLLVRLPYPLACQLGKHD